MRVRGFVLAGLVALVCVAAAPAVSHATVTCPPGTTNPAYCTSSPDFCVYVDSPVLRLTSGHVFVQLLPDRGPQKGSKNLVYGLGPVSVWKAFGGVGEISSNATHGWDYKICFPVTPEQYDKMAKFIRESIAKPPKYDLLESNCVIWSENVAATGGIRLPSSINRAGIADPAAFEDSLESIGVGGTFRGGTVKKNPGGVAPNGEADPVGEELDADSYEGLLEYAFGDPNGLVEGMHLVDHERQVHPRRLGAHERFAIDLRDVSAKRAIVAVDWGDGSTTTLQKTRSSHEYSHQGRYTAKIVVVRNSTLFRASIPVDVGHGKAGASVKLTVRHDGAQPNFPPLPKAEEPDEVPTS